MALSQSLPTPKTSELLPIVLRLTAGAPEGALEAAIAPIGVQAFAPAIAMTVAEADSPRGNRACTLALLRTFGAQALQISAVPAWRSDQSVGREKCEKQLTGSVRGDSRNGDRRISAALISGLDYVNRWIRL